MHDEMFKQNATKFWDYKDLYLVGGFFVPFF